MQETELEMGKDQRLGWSCCEPWRRDEKFLYLSGQEGEQGGHEQAFVK